MSSEIVPLDGEVGTGLTVEGQKLKLALREFASTVGIVKDEQVPQALQILKEGQELFKGGYENMRERFLKLAKEQGTKVGDKGSMQLEMGGKVGVAVPTRSGYDPKLVEAMLRRRKLDPGTWMEMEITYGLDLFKLASAREQGLIDDADLEGCKYKPSYRVEVRDARSEG